LGLTFLERKDNKIEVRLKKTVRNEHSQEKLEKCDGNSSTFIEKKKKQNSAEL